MESCQAQAKHLKECLQQMGDFDILSKDIGVPLVAFSLKDRSGFDEYDVADALRTYGWIVPAYTMAPDAQVCHFELKRRRIIWFSEAYVIVDRCNFRV